MAELEGRLDRLDPAVADDLRSVVDHLVRRSVWIVGGDGWAYDIGSGGLDHVLASGRNVNVLVLDTEVYSNTGGQMSKSTPLGAVAKFAAGGKTVPQEGPGAAGDRLRQRLRRAGRDGRRPAADAAGLPRGGGLRRAVAGHRLQPLHRPRHRHAQRTGPAVPAVASGHWPLVRYDPVLRAAGDNPFLLDSHRPRIPLADYPYRELRYREPGQRRPGGGRAAAGTGPGGGRPALGNLRGDGDPAVAQRLPARRHGKDALMDLSTRYLAATAQPAGRVGVAAVASTVDGVRRLADAGVGAVVLYSLFEEQIRREAERECAAGRRRHRELRRVADATSRPRCGADAGPRRYLSLLERAATQRSTCR